MLICEMGRFEHPYFKRMFYEDLDKQHGILSTVTGHRKGLVPDSYNSHNFYYTRVC